jgi:hypothetical protein
MNAINNIAKYKAIILIIGMIAALGIVAQPVLKNYVDCSEVCNISKEVESEDNTSEESEKTENETQVSALEAVAPTAQVQVSPLDFVLVDRIVAAKPKAVLAVKAAVKLPKKLLKVLFTILIAPNAP